MDSNIINDTCIEARSACQTSRGYKFPLVVEIYDADIRLEGNFRRMFGGIEMFCVRPKSFLNRIPERRWRRQKSLFFNLWLSRDDEAGHILLPLKKSAWELGAISREFSSLGRFDSHKNSEWSYHNQLPRLSTEDFARSARPYLRRELLPFLISIM